MHHLLNIELTVDREQVDHFEVTISTYQLETSERFTLTADERAQLDAFIEAGVSPSALDEAIELGENLFRFIFRGEVLAEWRAVYRAAVDSGYFIRLTLNFTTRDSQDLLYWPWEVLRDPERSQFLVLDEYVTLVRRVGGPVPRPRTIKPPLRILGVMSQPANAPALENAVAERDALTRAVRAMDNRVTLTWVSPATPREVIRELRDGEYDVLHYIGHAKQTGDEGIFVLESGEGDTMPLTADELATRADHPNLSMVVLNACETGAPASEQHAFKSLARSLMRQLNIPTVIANRFVIGDEAAYRFAEQFYATLLAGDSVEIATSRARRAMAETRRPDWLSPMLLTYLDQPVTLGIQPPTTLLDRLLSFSPVFFSVLLGLVVALVTITVVATWRQLGPAVAVILQLAALVVSAWFAYDSREKIRERVTYIVPAVAAGLIAAGIWFAWTPTIEITEPPRALDFEIVEPPKAFRPDEARAVRLTTPVRGTIRGMPENHTLWLLLRVDNGSRYTPLVRGDVRPDGTFEAREVFIGPVARRELNNRVYHIQPILADAEADARLELWSQNVLVFFHPDVRLIPEPRLDDALVVRR